MSYNQLYTFLKDKGVNEKYIKRSCEIRNKININVKRIIPIAFYCLYQAYRELGETMPYMDVAALVGLNTKKIHKALSDFAAHKTGYHPPIVDVTIKDLVIYYNNKLGHKNKENKILNYYQNVITYLYENDDIVLNRKPYIIASAIVYCYYSDEMVDPDQFFNFDTKVIQSIIGQIYKIDI